MPGTPKQTTQMMEEGRGGEVGGGGGKGLDLGPPGCAVHNDQPVSICNCGRLAGG
jgi:hypothetical protein